MQIPRDAGFANSNMEAVISKNPDIEGKILSREKEMLPEGAVVYSGDTIITDKSIALRMFDLDYPIFIIDKDGNSVYPSSRAEIEQHSGMYSAPERDYSECVGGTVVDSSVIEAISEVTGYSVRGINALPEDVLTNVINVWQINSRADTAILAKKLNAAIDCKPSENPLKSVEELVEGNANSIDGIINNTTPPAENERRSILAELRVLREQSTASSEQNREINR